MPVKRKRGAAAGDGKTDDHEGSPIPTPSHTKRRKKNLQFDSSDICHEIYEVIRNYKDQDGRMTCESFIRAPKRRTTADYYDVVSTPIDLLKIQQKIKTDEYEDVEQMTVDVELLVNNAKTYYKKNSQEYKDACDLWDLYIQTKDDMLSDTIPEKPTKKPTHHGDTTEEDEDVEKIGEDLNESNHSTGSTSTKPFDPEDLETLFTAVMKAKDGEREISEIFQLLPSKSKYPEYYEIIKEPMDLKMVALKIQENQYKSLEELEKDLLLIVRNAKSFNEPKSLIYKDACTIKKVIIAKKVDLDGKRSGHVKTSERLRTRERGPVEKMSAVCAALKYNSEDEEVATSSQDNSSQLEYDDDSGAETTILEDESPIQQLFSTIRNFSTQNGDVVAEPFLKLPNRRFYPDYYEEIKRPLSLFNIRKKLGHKHYKTLDELANDINLVLENAKQYNTENSLIYKNAVFLQRLTFDKKKELEKKFEKELWEEQENRSKPRKSLGGPESEKKRVKGRSPADESHLKRRLHALYKSVHEYVDNGGRALRDIFMSLPSKKDYPSYYQVIMQPIDMTLIDMKIKGEKYQHESQLISDFELMFSNARLFNEEGSQVYKDADTLERVLKNKYRFLCQQAEAKKSQYKRARAKTTSPVSHKLQDLYEFIRDLGDSKGRNLVSPFIKLPSKTEYPNYYDIIKKPIDLQKIQQKMVMSQYEALEDMVADFLLMFDNACKYNECDSTIYKDALTLQRACLEKKVELSEEGNNDPPDVRGFVQEFITNLFISTFNFQDEEGRCYSDSFAELPERDPQDDGIDKTKQKPLTFDQIKRNIDKQRYRRVDRFQDDMFSVFDRARRLSRTDSQVYEDAVEMQMFFLKIRDELSKNGEILLTPALSYTERHLQTALTKEKHEKLPLEQKEDEEKRKQQESEDKSEVGNMEEDGDESVKFKEETYHVGDFVYIEPREKNLEPHIMCIEKLYKDPSGDQLIHGNWFYRPNETFHLATRKFLEKEVFKSDISTSIPLFQVLGKCHVMFVKEYFKQKPEGLDNKHVYVCESRYSLRQRCFKKIKAWTVPKNENIKLVTREIPLVPVRVTSVFADKTQPVSNVIDDDGDMGILDKIRLTVPAETTNEDGNKYFEQFNIPAGSFKLGDCVYVRSDQNRTLIARIEKMWTDKNEHPFFYGPWFVGPGDVDHSPTRLFFKKEVFLSSIEDTNSMHSIIGKCCVLHMKDYCCSRPTEIPEPDLYVCESKYLEGERTIKKISKGFKKMFKLSPKVTDDEMLFFKKMNIPRKEPSPLLPREEYSFAYDNEETQDTEADTIGDESINMSFDTHVGKPKKVKNPNKRVPSGYIVFAGEMRKVISQENPECTFGDVSRIVGTKAKDPYVKRVVQSGYILFSGEMWKVITSENPDSAFGDVSKIVGTKWRALPKEEKEKYEGRAKKLADEQKKKREEQKALNESLNRSPSPWSDFGKMSPGSSRPHTPGSTMTPALAFQQGQYPTTPAQGYAPNQMMSPNAGMPPGGMQPMFPRGPSGGMPGQRPFVPPYQQGARNMTPYPNMAQERYPLSMPNHSFSQSHSPFTEQTLGSSQPPNLLQAACDGQQQMVPPPPPPRPPSPMFVTVPPRTQRLLHSEAYLKYIEGLTPEKKTITDWDKTLTATQDNTTPVDERTLPSQWLSQGAGYHGSVTDALWALRDLMLKDTLSITRTLPFEALYCNCGVGDKTAYQMCLNGEYFTMNDMFITSSASTGQQETCSCTIQGSGDWIYRITDVLAAQTCDSRLELNSAATTIQSECQTITQQTISGSADVSMTRNNGVDSYCIHLTGFMLFLSCRGPVVTTTTTTTTTTSPSVMTTQSTTLPRTSSISQSSSSTVTSTEPTTDTTVPTTPTSTQSTTTTQTQTTSTPSTTTPTHSTSTPSTTTQTQTTSTPSTTTQTASTPSTTTQTQTTSTPSTTTQTTSTPSSTTQTQTTSTPSTTTQTTSTPSTTTQTTSTPSTTTQTTSTPSTTTQTQTTSTTSTTTQTTSTPSTTTQTQTTSTPSTTTQTTSTPSTTTQTTSTPSTTTQTTSTPSTTTQTQTTSTPSATTQTTSTPSTTTPTQTTSTPSTTTQIQTTSTPSTTTQTTSTPSTTTQTQTTSTPSTTTQTTTTPSTATQIQTTSTPSTTTQTTSTPSTTTQTTSTSPTDVTIPPTNATSSSGLSTIPTEDNTAQSNLTTTDGTVNETTPSNTTRPDASTNGLKSEILFPAIGGGVGALVILMAALCICFGRRDRPVQHLKSVVTRTNMADVRGQPSRSSSKPKQQQQQQQKQQKQHQQQQSQTTPKDESVIEETDFYGTHEDQHVDWSQYQQVPFGGNPTGNTTASYGPYTGSRGDMDTVAKDDTTSPYQSNRTNLNTIQTDNLTNVNQAKLQAPRDDWARGVYDYAGRTSEDYLNKPQVFENRIYGNYEARRPKLYDEAYIGYRDFIQ